VSFYPIPILKTDPNPMTLTNTGISTNSVVIAAILVSITVGTAHAQQRKLPVWKQRRSALDKSLVVDELRIHYTLNGEDALPDAVDANKNSIPDRIDNIAIQMTTARYIYNEILKLRPPLESPRYKGDAKFIDINVGKIPFSPGEGKTNGSAGDAAVNYYRPADPEDGVRVLSIDLMNTLPAKNVSPAHELFHLYQYGYSMFKAAWFTEGTARWIQYMLDEGSGQPKGVPLTKAELDKLFTMKYEAEGFWSTLGQASDPRGQLRIPLKFRRLRYVGSNEPVIRDTKSHGSLFVKQLLEAMDAADDKTREDRNLDPLFWKEDEQRSAENNPYMWSAVIEVARKYSLRSPAVKKIVQQLSR
jgi:hypothetical protein